MSGSFVRFGVVVFKRRRRHPYNRRSSSVGYLHCRRNEFLPVNKRVDFTTVNQATRRFRPLRLWNLCPPLSIAPCSFFFFFFSLVPSPSSFPPPPFSSFFIILSLDTRDTFVPPGMEERLLYLLRYCISLPREEITVDFHKIETTTLHTPCSRNRGYRCVLTGAPVFIVLVFLCSTYPPNRFNIHIRMHALYNIFELEVWQV